MPFPFGRGRKSSGPIKPRVSRLRTKLFPRPRYSLRTAGPFWAHGPSWRTRQSVPRELQRATVGLSVMPDLPTYSMYRWPAGSLDDPHFFHRQGGLCGRIPFLNDLVPFSHICLAKPTQRTLPHHHALDSALVRALQSGTSDRCCCWHSSFKN